MNSEPVKLTNTNKFNITIIKHFDITLPFEYTTVFIIYNWEIFEITIKNINDVDLSVMYIVHEYNSHCLIKASHLTKILLCLKQHVDEKYYYEIEETCLKCV